MHMRIYEIQIAIMGRTTSAGSALPTLSSETTCNQVTLFKSSEVVQHSVLNNLLLTKIDIFSNFVPDAGLSFLEWGLIFLYAEVLE